MPDLSSDFKPGDRAAALLAAILDASDDAIIRKDVEGVIASWNRAAEGLYGYSAEEIVGRSIAVLMPDGRRDEFVDILRQVRQGKAVERLQTHRMRKDGQLVDVALTVWPITDEAGHVTGALAIARNLSALKRAELAFQASEARWRAAVESAVDGIIVIDTRGVIESFNPAAERLFGYGATEVLGRSVNLLMPPPYSEEHDEHLARYVATGVGKIIGIGREVPARRRDGGTFPARLAVGELAVGGERRFIGIVHDLTERVRMEEQLREQTALAKLGEMAAVVAHEVRNALAAIHGAVQVIGRDWPGGSRNASAVTQILARIDAVNKVVTDMLLFARLPQPRLGTVDVAHLVGTAVALVQQEPIFQNVRVQLTGSAPSIAAAADLLQVVLTNVLTNSAQAMGGEGTIQVSVASLDSSCRIVVTDQGPGIPANVRDRLFTPFFTTKASGSGLGLSIAKRIIEAHQGTLGVECPPGGGTVVRIELPSLSPSNA